MEKVFENEIKEGLRTNWLGNNIFYYQSVDSTQSEAYNLAKKKFPHGTIIIAEEQRKGRGRLGREWHSEKGKGIWMSILLRPTFSISFASRITLLTSIVIYRVFKKVFAIESKIKWPNDIYINDKKCTGILCEAKGESDKYCLIVGIGINTIKTEYPDMIKDRAISIEEIIKRLPQRLEIITELLNEFEKAYEIFQEKGFESFYDEYVNAMYRLNMKIRHNKIVGVIKGIDENGHLVVKKDDGQIINISSGEIDFLF